MGKLPVIEQNNLKLFSDDLMKLAFFLGCVALQQPRLFSVLQVG